MKRDRFKSIVFLFILSFSCLLVIATPPAHAAGVRLQADPKDNPLVIFGILDGQTTAFSGTIRLTAIGGDVSDLQLLASDLHVTSTATSANPNTIIGRSNISIPQTNLMDGQPKDVRVTVSNVTQPDDYQGTLKFLIPGQHTPQGSACAWYKFPRFHSGGA